MKYLNVRIYVWCEYRWSWYWPTACSHRQIFWNPDIPKSRYSEIQRSSDITYGHVLKYLHLKISVWCAYILMVLPTMQLPECMYRLWTQTSSLLNCGSLRDRYMCKGASLAAPSVCTCEWMYVCVHICVCTCIYVCMYTCMYARITSRIWQHQAAMRSAGLASYARSCYTFSTVSSTVIMHSKFRKEPTLENFSKYFLPLCLLRNLGRLFRCMHITYKFSNVNLSKHFHKLWDYVFGFQNKWISDCSFVFYQFARNKIWVVCSEVVHGLCQQTCLQHDRHWALWSSDSCSSWDIFDWCCFYYFLRNSFFLYYYNIMHNIEMGTPQHSNL